MVTGLIVIVTILLFGFFFIIYKRNMLTEMFSLNASASADRFREQLENTADEIIKRLENHVSHLEFLLDEADSRIALLENMLRKSEELRLKSVKAEEQANNQANKQDYYEKNSTPDISDRVNLSQDSDNNDKRRLILAMANQGYNVTEIAKATGLGKGEVMLLLQLNKK